MLRKAYKYFLTILLILSPITYRPFSIYGDYYNTAPFVGINYYIEDYDNENRVTLNSGNTTLSLSGSQTNTLLVQRTTNGVTYVTSTYSQGGVNGNGGNITLSGNINLNSTITNTQVVYRVIKFNIVLDNNYIGYIRPRVVKSGNSTNLFQQDLAVNGNSVEFSIVDNDVSTSATYSVTWSDFNLIQNNEERWNFPLESYTLSQLFFRQGLPLLGINQYNDYSYPMFQIGTGFTLRGYWSGGTATHDQILIFGSETIIVKNNFSTYFTLDNFNLKEFKTLFIQDSGGKYFNIVRIVCNVQDSSNNYWRITPKQTMSFMPIYLNYASATNNSLDFALNFDLENSIIQDLDVIANGTSESNTSSDNLDNSNSSVSTVVDEYDSIESNFNDSLNSSLNDIDTSLTPSSMGSKFQTSAIWVRTQFNRMTNNTPFGSIMGFSLLLGLSLLIIGKINR